MRETLLYILAAFNMISMIHLGLFIVGANAYDIKQFRKAKRSRTNTHRPLVSVVIPAHNESVVIERTLDSVRASSYKNIEIIVVDDGSQDDTSEIIRNYLKRVRLVEVEGSVARRQTFKRRAMGRATTTEL